MSPFIALTCPSCSGELRVTTDVERFSCQHCGKEALLRKAGDAFVVVPIVRQLERIGSSVDRQAAELAIRRLREDRQEVKKRIQHLSDEADTAIAAVQRDTLTAAVMIGVSALSLVIAIPIAREGSVVGCCAFMTICFCMVIGVAGVVKLLSQGHAKSRVQSARAKLPPLQERLAEIEKELDHHHEIVRIDC